jgi:DNA-binding winged helix-turn-helix (wHTH) protein
VIPPSDSRPTLHFGEFVLDLAAYQLRRDGRPVKLGRQPMELLILLVERRGQLVTRADIVARLWGPDVFVDVETGVNTAISKVRQALRDAADAPRFLETVPGKGYRFVAPVDGPPAAGLPTVESRTGDRPAGPAVTPPVSTALAPTLSTFRQQPAIAVAALVALLAVIAAGVLAIGRARGTAKPTAVAIAVLPFVNLGPDVERDYLAAGLTDDTSASLARIDPGTSRSRVAASPTGTRPRRPRRSARSSRSITWSRARYAPRARGSG